MTQQQRLTDPMVWRYGQMHPTSWDDALDDIARFELADFCRRFFQKHSHIRHNKVDITTL